MHRRTTIGVGRIVVVIMIGTRLIGSTPAVASVSPVPAGPPWTLPGPRVRTCIHAFHVAGHNGYAVMPCRLPRR